MLSVLFVVKKLSIQEMLKFMTFCKQMTIFHM